MEPCTPRGVIHLPVFIPNVSSQIVGSISWLFWGNRGAKGHEAFCYCHCVIKGYTDNNDLTWVELMCIDVRYEWYMGVLMVTGIGYWLEWLLEWMCVNVRSKDRPLGLIIVYVVMSSSWREAILNKIIRIYSSESTSHVELCLGLKKPGTEKAWDWKSPGGYTATWQTQRLLLLFLSGSWGQPPPPIKLTW